jgi:hypothetical protein
VTIGPSSGMHLLMSFAMSMELISNFLSLVCLNRIELWNERTAL